MLRVQNNLMLGHLTWARFVYSQYFEVCYCTCWLFRVLLWRTIRCYSALWSKDLIHWKWERGGENPRGIWINWLLICEEWTSIHFQEYLGIGWCNSQILFYSLQDLKLIWPVPFQLLSSFDCLEWEVRNGTSATILENSGLTLQKPCISLRYWTKWNMRVGEKLNCSQVERLLVP